MENRLNSTGQDIEALEPLVADFELSCLLLSAGFPQNTILFWHESRIKIPGKPKIIFLSTEKKGATCAAPTAEEVARILPSQYVTMQIGTVYKFIDLMQCDYKHIDAAKPEQGGGIVIKEVKGCEGKTEVECRVRGALVLIAKGLFKKMAEPDKTK